VLGRTGFSACSCSAPLVGLHTHFLAVQHNGAPSDLLAETPAHWLVAGSGCLSVRPTPSARQLGRSLPVPAFLPVCLPAR
jgi:hypothetical protein